MVQRRFRRPRNKIELENLELEGFWKAIARSKEISESKAKITLNTIRDIHKEMFAHAIPEIAGRFRDNGQDVEPLSGIAPPPGRLALYQTLSRTHEFFLSLQGARDI